MKCLDDVISQVLIDIGSSLNVMPKSTPTKLSCKETLIRPSVMVVKAFEVSRRIFVCEMDIPIQIGPHVFQITFQVMNINPAYNFLLGRPWIYVVGVVTSTLHKKMKFVVKGKLIIMSREEDLLVSHLLSFQYIEASMRYQKLLSKPLK